MDRTRPFRPHLSTARRARRVPLLAAAVVAAAVALPVLGGATPAEADAPPGVTVDIDWTCMPNGGNRFFWQTEVRNESAAPVTVQLVIGSWSSSPSVIGPGGAVYGGGPYQPDGLPSSIQVLVDGQVAGSASVALVDCLPDQPPEAVIVLDCPHPVEDAGEDIAVVMQLRSIGTATTFTSLLPDGSLDTRTIADEQVKVVSKVFEGDALDVWVSADGGATRLAELATVVDCEPEATTTTAPVTTAPSTTEPDTSATTDPGAPTTTDTGSGAEVSGTAGGASSGGAGWWAGGSGGVSDAAAGGATLPSTGVDGGLLVAALASIAFGAAALAAARRRA